MFDRLQPDDVRKETTTSDPTSAAKRDRILSLDVLRGFDVFWIVGGSSVAVALANYTNLPFFRVIAEQMKHAEWAGFYAIDLIFPLFIFIMGVLMPFSTFATGDQKPLARYMAIARRGLALFALGIFYNHFLALDFSRNVRLASVLGLIGAAYVIAALIYLHFRKPREVILWLVAIISVYSVLQLAVPMPVGAGVLTPDGSINSYVDRRFLPGTLIGGSYDSEGILNCLIASSLALMGILAGMVLKRHDSGRPMRTPAALAAIGVVLALSASFANPWYPIIKDIWTATYALFAGGLSFLLLAAFYTVFDLWRIRFGTVFFSVLGVNALLAFLAGRLVAALLERTGALLSINMGTLSAVLLEATGAFLLWLGLYFLFRRRIYLII